MTCQVQLLRIVPQCGPMYFPFPRPAVHPLPRSLSLHPSLAHSRPPSELYRLLNFVPPFVSWFYNVSPGNLVRGPKVRTYMRRAIACCLSLDSRRTSRATVYDSCAYTHYHLLRLVRASSADALPPVRLRTSRTLAPRGDTTRSSHHVDRYFAQ